MKLVEWKTYRTRFLVRAKQLSSNLSFTDHLGRQHCGRKGDYLVESYDGVLSIAPRQIFEDVYVEMNDTSNPDPGRDEKEIQGSLRFEPLRIEKVKVDLIGPGKRNASLEKLPRVRKSPQSIRTQVERLSLM